MRSKVRVQVIDRRILVGEGMACLLAAGGFAAVACAPDDAIRAAGRFRPDVVLLDAALPRSAAWTLARSLAAHSPDAAIVFLDEEVRLFHLREALKAHGRGYWTKLATPAAMAAAVRAAAAGQPTFCPEVRDLVAAGPDGPAPGPSQSGSPLDRLTARELQIVGHLADGRSVKQCGERMRLSVSTVDNHKLRLMKKLGVHKLVELVRLAIREGLIEA